jgi:hypothetical protein
VSSSEYCQDDSYGSGRDSGPQRIVCRRRQERELIAWTDTKVVAIVIDKIFVGKPIRPSKLRAVGAPPPKRFI